jgi:hypothetical protein
VAVILLGWYLANRTWRSYETYHFPRPAGSAPVAAAPDFLRGRHTVRRLRIIHVTAASLGTRIRRAAPSRR